MTINPKISLYLLTTYMNSSTYLVPVSEMASSLVKSYICLHSDNMKHDTIL